MTSVLLKRVNWRSTCGFIPVSDHIHVLFAIKGLQPQVICTRIWSFTPVRGHFNVKSVNRHSHWREIWRSIWILYMQRMGTQRVFYVKRVLLQWTNPRKQGLWDQHRAHLGQAGPRQAPHWPHEPACFLGLEQCRNLALEDAIASCYHLRMPLRRVMNGPNSERAHNQWRNNNAIMTSKRHRCVALTS